MEKFSNRFSILVFILCITVTMVFPQTHVVVHKPDSGRAHGWPANGGIWNWGNEILVMYLDCPYRLMPGHSNHDSHQEDPSAVYMTSRSFDGGETWTEHQVAFPWIRSNPDVKPTKLKQPIDFSDPNTIVNFHWDADWRSYLYYSTDKGHTWNGPYDNIPMFDFKGIGARSDYEVTGKHSLTAWFSCNDISKKDCFRGSTYAFKTSDGGISWKLGPRISRKLSPCGSPYRGLKDIPLTSRSEYAHMSSTVRIDEKTLVSTFRSGESPGGEFRKYGYNHRDGWIDVTRSTDNGKTWQPVNGHLMELPTLNSVPPALSVLPDGRLVCSFGYRLPDDGSGPTSIRARISDDQGETWGKTLILREDGYDYDIAYNRQVVRPDGKVVTVYYYRTMEDGQSPTYIAATIWDPSMEVQTLSMKTSNWETRDWNWSKEPVVTNRIKDKSQPVSYSGQFLYPTSYLGRRVKINFETGLLKTFNVDGYLNSYGTKPKWPTGEYLGKFMQGLSRMYLYTGEPEAKERLDKIVEKWLAIQEDDGWLGTTGRFKSWDIWEHKYVLLGLIDYYALTGEEQALAAAKKIGDLYCASIGPNLGDIMQSGHWAMGSASILEPMVYLYQYTGQQKYLDFCEYIVTALDGPTGPKLIHILTEGSGRVCDIEDPWANRAAREVFWEKHNVGQIRNRSKGYEMLSCIIGLVRLHQVTGKATYLDVALNAWQDISENRLYLTGSSGADECFKDDHCLPADRGDSPAEACVTAHWIFLNRILFQITGELKYVDAAEIALYNYMPASQRPQDCFQSYNTPMNGHKRFLCHDPEGKVGGAPCCISSTMREIARTPELIWQKFTDNGLAILLYNGGIMQETIHTDSGPLKLSLEMNTVWPVKNEILVRVQPERTAAFRLALRVPPWASEFSAQIDGKTYQGKAGTFLDLNRTWKKGDEIRITMDMNERLESGGASYPGYFAFMRGPQVLTLVAGEKAEDQLENVTVNAKKPMNLKQNYRLPAGWRGDQAYTSSLLNNADNCLLVPFSDAGQPGKSDRFQTWIPIEPGTGRSAPTAPSGLKAIALSKNEIQLTWKDNCSREKGFRIERKRSDVGKWFHVKTTLKNITSCTDGATNVTLPGKTYIYRVAAYHESGLSAYTDTVTVTTPNVSIPSAPSKLKASKVTNSLIRLTWKDNSNSEEGFRVERRNGKDSDWIQVAGRVAADYPVFTDYGLEPTKTYSYRVRAYNSAGASEWSDVRAFTTE